MIECSSKVVDCVSFSQSFDGDERDCVSYRFRCGF